MNVDELERLLAAPELVMIQLLEHALSAPRPALLAEHPLLDDDFSAPEDPPVRRRARVVLAHADRLRRALDAYRREVDKALGSSPNERDPLF